MIYVISDLHGYPFDSFLGLLRKADFSDEDFLYVLGDIIDRGDDGVKYLLWLLERKNAELILGNHEKMMLSCPAVFDRFSLNFLTDPTREQRISLAIWNANGAEPTINGLMGIEYEKRREIYEYVSRAPLYKEITVGGRDYILVHSGLRDFHPSKSLDEYSKDDLLWNRPELSERYFDDKTVIFGHTPSWDFGEGYEGKIIFTDTWIDIDAGAGAGFPPVMLRLDDMRQFAADGEKPDMSLYRGL